MAEPTGKDLMGSFIKTLATNWHAVRWIRAAFSIVLFISYFSNGDNFALLGGLIFAYQAIFNVGCCGASGCSTNARPSEQTIEVKEIKKTDYLK